MDETAVALAKLDAIQQTLAGLLKNNQHLVFGLEQMKDYFARYANYLGILKKEHYAIFDDLPVRAIPNDEISIKEGRIGRSYVQQLHDDIVGIIRVWDNLHRDKSGSYAFKIAREGVFFAGQRFDALLRIRDILASAKKEIMIIDNYINEDLLNTASAKNRNVDLLILTKSVTPAVKTAALAFNSQYGRLQIKASHVFHDRFVMIDQAELYHFGASLKDAGARGFMFSLIEEPSVLAAVKSSWASEWASSISCL